MAIRWVSDLFHARRGMKFVNIINRTPDLDAEALLNVLFFVNDLFHGKKPDLMEFTTLEIDFSHDTVKQAMKNCHDLSSCLQYAARFQSAPRESVKLFFGQLLMLNKSQLSEEMLPAEFLSLMAAAGLSSADVHLLVEEELKRKRRGEIVLHSGAGLMVTLIVLVLFILTATFLKSLLFGLILAYFFLPLEKFFEEKIFLSKVMCSLPGISNRIANKLRPDATEEERKKTERSILIMKSSAATVGFIALAVIAVLCAVLLILLPAAANAGKFLQTWSEQNPVIRDVHQNVSSWLNEQNAMSNTNSQKNANEQTYSIATYKEILIHLRPNVKSYFNENYKDITAFAFSRGQNLVKLLFSMAAKLGNFAFHLLLTFFFFFYFLQQMARFITRSHGSLGQWCVKSLFSTNWMPNTGEQARTDAAGVIDHIATMLNRWIRGYLWIMIIEIPLYMTSFTLLNVPYGLILAVFSGMTILLPFLALLAMICISTLVCICFCEVNTLAIIAGVLVTYLLVNGILEQLVLYPSFVGGAIGLTTLETIIVVLLGGMFAGVTGMIFAVPAAAVIKFLIPKVYKLWSAPN